VSELPASGAQGKRMEMQMSEKGQTNDMTQGKKQGYFDKTLFS
jgi:hypothetical protein